ncbi:MAG: hypothetical protein ACXWDO_04815 [Bacteroidia bacterium]
MINLGKGLLLEDKNVLLEWGKPIHKIEEKLNKTGQDKGDRTVYNWGTHTILNGLELDLSNHFWNHGKEYWFRKFNKIEFWAIGDNSAIENFDRISIHLLKNIGEPKTKDESNSPEKLWRWEIDDITLSLYFFEQHAYKLHFVISKN